MRAPSTIVLVIGLCIGGCSGGCSGPSEPPSPTSTATQRTEASGSETEPGSVPHAAVDPGPPPSLRVTGEPDRYDRQVAIHVENHGADAAEVRSRLELQRRNGERWEEVSAARIELRFSCEDEAAECVTLAPGAVYIPPAWLGTQGDAQCTCTRCAPAPAGTYRFVATSCNGAHTISGDAFELAAAHGG